MGKIIAYCKIGCPHSEETRNTLKRIMMFKPRNNYKIDIDIRDVMTNQNEIISINEDLMNERKDDFLRRLSYDKKLKNIEQMRNHRTFPIIFYETSKGDKYLIGGNDKFQNVIKMISDNVDNYKLLDTEGEKRLGTSLLLFFEKIK